MLFCFSVPGVTLEVWRPAASGEIPAGGDNEWFWYRLRPWTDKVHGVFCHRYCTFILTLSVESC